jgi:hypothetical protein
MMVPATGRFSRPREEHHEASDVRNDGETLLVERRHGAGDAVATIRLRSAA